MFCPAKQDYAVLENTALWDVLFLWCRPCVMMYGNHVQEGIEDAGMDCCWEKIGKVKSIIITQVSHIWLSCWSDHHSAWVSLRAYHGFGTYQETRSRPNGHRDWL